MGRVYLSVVEEAERRMPIYQVDNDKQAMVLNCKHTPAKLADTYIYMYQKQGSGNKRHI